MDNYIYKYDIVLKDDGTVAKEKEVFTVVAVGDSRFNGIETVIRNAHGFRILQDKEDKHTIHTVLNVPKVFKMEWIHQPNELRGYLYTYNSNDKVGYRRVKKALEKFIKAKYGKYTMFSNGLEELGV